MPSDLIRRHVSLARLACFVFAGQLACGEPLAPSSYRGEPIFRAQGNALSTSSGDNWQQLKAVLAFVTDTELELSDSITVRPVDEGGIGGDFQLELFDAPPATTMIDFEEHPEWGQISIALIAAVPKSHPPRLSRGDPTLGQQPLPVDAVVANFTLFYLEQPAAAGSPLAEYLFHTKFDLDAGYHLIEATPKQVPDDTYDEYDFKVIGSEDVVLRFERDVLPWGVNL